MAINRIKTGGITDGTIQSGDLAPGNIANDRLANNTITINGTSIALGASGDIVAGTDWQAVTVADGSTTVNTVAGGGYLLDTNAGVIEAFLPTSPSRGDTVVIADYSGTFATNRVIVNTGGANIDSTATGDVQLTTNNTIAEFIYIDSSKGWLVKLNQAAGTTPGSVLTDGLYDTDPTFISATGGTVTESGDYKIHSFTGDGCFVVSSLGTGGPCAQNEQVEYVVVAGGGAGGGACFSGTSARESGGGGAGGFRSYTALPCSSPLNAPTGLTVTATTYPITVGGGASSQTNPSGNAPSGSPSTFSTITSAGGGGAGAGFYPPTIPQSDGNPGGSGGASGAKAPSGGGNIGLGNNPPVSPPQGNNGGTGGHVGGCWAAGGGGGGAGAAGAAGSNPGTPGVGDGGTGGVGSYVPGCFGIPAPLSLPGPVGCASYFAGGGGGGSMFASGPTAALGGSGGGGAGMSGPPGIIRVVGAGADNSGGGGGGQGRSGPANRAGNGGKGIVVIRYKFQ